MVELPPLGTRVRIRLPKSPACHAHDQANVPRDGMEGVVERLDPDRDHPVVVGFDTRWLIARAVVHGHPLVRPLPSG